MIVLQNSRNHPDVPAVQIFKYLKNDFQKYLLGPDVSAARKSQTCEHDFTKKYALYPDVPATLLRPVGLTATLSLRNQGNVQTNQNKS